MNTQQIPTGKELEIGTSRQFSSWLAEQGASIALTTYQAGKVFLLGTNPDGQLSVFERTLERCMGLAVHGTSLYISSLYQIWRFEDAVDEGQNKDGYDACYIPQMSYVTGDIDIHDMAVGPDGKLVFVNTLFNCLAGPSESASFVPVWQPPFISKLAAEDRCHLNGMAADETGPRYLSAVSESDALDGWRDNRKGGGIIIDYASKEIVARGLSMPHSPRLYKGELWILNSGNGTFGNIDPKTGEFEEVCFCTGYARGMTFINGYAVIGLSLPRDNKTFQGLALDDELGNRKVAPRCGLMVVDLDTGDVVHWLRFEGVVTELYDVASLMGVKRPSMIGFKSDEIRRVLKVGQSG